MPRVCGLVLTTVVLLCCASCAQQVQNNNATANSKAVNSTAANSTAAASPSPTSTEPTPTTTPDVPTTASVKTSGIAWRDERSGTAETTIKVGGTVTWTVPPGIPHSLKSVAGTAENGCDQLDPKTFDGNLPANQPVTKKFDKVGVFGYQCGIHKGTPNCKTPPGDPKTGMPGVIRVVP